MTLLTDFGLSGHYVAAMKGAILTVCPRARIVDISHQVSPYQIQEAAYLLSQSWRYFPEGSIHVAVVDPGVGSARRPILLRSGGHLFVGPDNGIFSLIPAGEALHLNRGEFFRSPASRTFHGRDIFAPVAGHLAGGAAPRLMGEPVDHLEKLESGEPVRVSAAQWRGAVLYVDRYGNVITNFPAGANGPFAPAAFHLHAGAMSVNRFASTYAASPEGELFLIEGSGGFWEISANQASAARRLGIRAGDGLALTLAPQDAGIGGS